MTVATIKPVVDRPIFCDYRILTKEIEDGGPSAVGAVSAQETAEREDDDVAELGACKE